MAVISATVPDVVRARVEAIKFGLSMDILDNHRVIVYGSDEKASQVIVASDGQITGRKNMVRRGGR
jgi:hypothetical protein